MEQAMPMIITALCSSGFTSIILYLIQRHDKKKDEKEEMPKTIKQIEERLDNQEKKLSDISEMVALQSKMQLAMGHDKLLELERKYIKRGGMTLRERSNLKMIFEPYEAMGGNGDGREGFLQCMKFPIITEEDLYRMEINKEG